MTASIRAPRQVRTADIQTGVVGLGLMGHSIIACLLSAGHEVIAVTRTWPGTAAHAAMCSTSYAR